MERQMSESAKVGRQRILIIFASMLLFEIINSYSRQRMLDAIDEGLLIRQTVRFCLTALLMLAVLEAKKWARILYSVLLVISILAGFAIFFIPSTLAQITPFIFLIILYTITFCYLNFSQDFKEYLDYKRNH